MCYKDLVVLASYLNLLNISNKHRVYELPNDLGFRSYEIRKYQENIKS